MIKLDMQLTKLILLSYIITGSLNPNQTTAHKGKIAVCGLSMFCLGWLGRRSLMSGHYEGATILQTAQHSSCAAVWVGVRWTVSKYLLKWREGGVLASAGHPWCWWHTGPCHTGTWPDLSWHGADGGYVSPGTGPCEWAFCRPWSSGCHHPFSGELCPETRVFGSSWLPWWTWWKAAHCWGGLGA